MIVWIMLGIAFAGLLVVFFFGEPPGSGSGKRGKQ